MEIPSELTEDRVKTVSIKKLKDQCRKDKSVDKIKSKSHVHFSKCKCCHGCGSPVAVILQDLQNIFNVCFQSFKELVAFDRFSRFKTDDIKANFIIQITLNSEESGDQNLSSLSVGRHNNYVKKFIILKERCVTDNEIWKYIPNILDPTFVIVSYTLIHAGF